MDTPDLEYDQEHELDPQLQVFELDPRLKADCVHLGAFPLCDLLLMNDSQYPWFILVPRRPEVSEIFQLSAEDQQQLVKESSVLSLNLCDIFAADKMNVAALGNVVKQLHLHHVVRYESDPAWPAPVWGKLPGIPYSPEKLAAIRQRVEVMLEDRVRFD